MAPISIFEGTRTMDPIAARRSAERRYAALAEAIREHERHVGARERRFRPYDESLYRRLREVAGADPVGRAGPRKLA